MEKGTLAQGRRKSSPVGRQSVHQEYLKGWPGDQECGVKSKGMWWWGRRHDLRGSWCLYFCNGKSLVFYQKSHMIKSVFHG